MPRGGARPGAGRKPGTPNRVTAELQAAVAASGETPLDYMLGAAANPFSTMGTSLWRLSKDEFEYGVSYGWQRQLRRWAADLSRV